MAAVAAVDAKTQIVMLASAFGTGQENALLPVVLQDLRADFDAMGKADPLQTATVLTDSGYVVQRMIEMPARLQKITEQNCCASGAGVFLRARWA